jgi:hypothetical protein
MATPLGFEPRITPPKGAALPKQSDLFDEWLTNSGPRGLTTPRGTSVRLTSRSIRYVSFFGLIERAAERFGTFPANSSEASLLLNSATSVAKMYRLFAIKCVRSHPAKSNFGCDRIGLTNDKKHEDEMNLQTLRKARSRSFGR